MGTTSLFLGLLIEVKTGYHFTLQRPTYVWGILENFGLVMYYIYIHVYHEIEVNVVYMIE